ncbi:MAG: hypothetical protein L0K90_01985 [Staphylococcus equorum]|nr:hypothetical protein [Staphylococcus equorum]
MIYVDDIKNIDLDNIFNSAKIIRTNKQVRYYNLACSFDIETTSYMQDDEKTAFMYIWMFQVENLAVYGRTWQEYQNFMFRLSNRYHLNADKRLIIYVHNLSFEFQFMKDYFMWENVFAIDERKPIKALTLSGMEYKDSYILAGYSLASVAKNLVSHTIEKLTGDLDYSLIRTWKTSMSEQELAYCEYDVRIVVFYIQEQIEQYGDVTKIPLTNTGRVRNEVRDNCYYTSKNHRKSSTGKYKRYRKLMNELTLTSDEYKQLKRAFQGGFTHANGNHSGKLLKNVSSIDFTSSYPAVMVSEKFPMSKPFKIEIQSMEQLRVAMKKYSLVFEVRFEGLESKFYSESYLSESKCRHIEKPIINNGRIFSADSLETTITEIDFSILEQCYNWENIGVTNVTAFYKDYLPKSIIESILKFYKGKTQLKNVEGSEVEYMRSKGMLNSVYGMSVTDIVQDESIFEEGKWFSEMPDFDEKIEKNNKSAKRFLYYPWGVFVTAYARRNLWTGIIEFNQDYIYSDTDSIKCLNYENHINYIKKYNQLVTKKVNQMAEHYQLSEELFRPKTIQGNVKPIGVWDFEGTYNRFKTLGAKRYLVEESGQLEMTVAGLSKQNGINYMIEQCNNDFEQVFEMFNDELYIPSERTGKMTHTYCDEHLKLFVTDYQGNQEEVYTKGGVHLEPCDFTLSISKEYGKFLNMLMQGYLFKGVSKTL